MLPDHFIEKRKATTKVSDFQAYQRFKHIFYEAPGVFFKNLKNVGNPKGIATPIVLHVGNPKGIAT